MFRLICARYKGLMPTSGGIPSLQVMKVTEHFVETLCLKKDSRRVTIAQLHSRLSPG